MSVTSETGVVTSTPAMHDLSLQDVLRLDRSVLSESLQRVLEHLSRDESEHVSRFNAAL
ncbi:hypothetical protein [Dactylosporangium sp. NPDC051541]|uniref:hypothetical protein n=1 Tax=Dactylosporangium sp. NPDC051541 TaxID=3363977 RepID=UPI0037BB56CE